MRAMAVCAGSLMIALTVLVGWAATAAEPTSRPATASPAPARTTDPEEFLRLKWDTSRKGREIDLSRYKRTFNDDFKAMDMTVKNVSAYQPKTPYKGG